MMHPYFRPATVQMMSWPVPGLCSIYDWPKNLPGGGVIGIGELDGGYLRTDIAAYFKSIGQPVPNIVDVSVLGGKNNPGKSDADVEVTLDIETAAAASHCATNKPASIRVYFAPNTAAAMPAVTRQAADEGCDVLIWCWGADEGIWRRPAVLVMEDAVSYATLKGTVVVVASGDGGSADGDPGANVDCPACCLHALGVGGTEKTIRAETVWSGSGGGFSKNFPMPSWQAGAPHGPGRMVPDVAANADPNTGYQIYVGGRWITVGGTSAAAPLWGGLIAQCGKKLGHVAPLFYLHHMAFNDILYGANGRFRARPGVDACTGLGSMKGVEIAALLAAKPTA